MKERYSQNILLLVEFVICQSYFVVGWTRSTIYKGQDSLRRHSQCMLACWGNKLTDLYLKILNPFESYYIAILIQIWLQFSHGHCRCFE